MKSETLFHIVQFIRTLLPIFAAIGTISSSIGFWRMFQKWNKPGVLSLVPFVRGWVFGKDSPKKARLLYAVSDGIIVVLTRFSITSERMEMCRNMSSEDLRSM